MARVRSSLERGFHGRCQTLFCGEGFSWQVSDVVLWRGIFMAYVRFSLRRDFHAKFQKLFFGEGVSWQVSVVVVV